MYLEKEETIEVLNDAGQKENTCVKCMRAFLEQYGKSYKIQEKTRSYKSV